MVTELEALRRQVADLPDVEEIERLRSRAAVADEVESNLPGWREQLAHAVAAQKAEGDAALSAVQQDLAVARLDQQAAAACFAAGVTEIGWPILRGALGDIQQAEDGSLAITTPDGPQPLADALRTLGDHPVYSACFAPRYGSGAGSRSGTKSRALPGVDYNNLSTEAKFKAAFGRKN